MRYVASESQSVGDRRAFLSLVLGLNRQIKFYREHSRQNPACVTTTCNRLYTHAYNCTLGDSQNSFGELSCCCGFIKMISIEQTFKKNSRPHSKKQIQRKTYSYCFSYLMKPRMHYVIAAVKFCCNSPVCSREGDIIANYGGNY